MSRFQKYIAAGSLFFFVAFSSLSAVYGESFLKDGAEPKKQDQKNFIGLDKVETGFLFDKTSKYVPGEVIVKFKTGEISLKGQTGLSVAKNFAAGRNLSLKENIGNQNIGVFKINGSRSVGSAVQELKKDPSVEYVQPNFIYYPLDIGSNITSNDTYKNLIWGMDNFGQTVNGITGTADADIDAPEAWAINEGTNGSVIVAVLDTGVAYNHPDLAANMWDGTNCVDENGDPLGGCNHGYDYYSADNDPLPTTNSHGTHVAGTIAAVKNNGEGVIGVAPNAKIMAVRVGNSYLSDSAILSGIAFAEQNGARVINASWGGSSGSCAGAYDEALYQAIEGFDGLFVAAAGNAAADHDGSTYVGIPADYGYETSCWAGLDNVISVAATNENDGLAFFSDYGENFIDVGAPGGENPDTSDGSIYSTVAYSTLLDEDLEGTIVPNIPADWTEEGAINNWRTASVSSSNVLYGDSSFPYADNATSSITSPAYDLSSTTAATLAFSASCDTAYELEDWTDYLSLFFSSDGTNFSEVMKLDEFYIDLVNGEDPYSSSSAASVYISGSLSSGYLTDDFKIRFGWTSDGDDNNYDGCWIDDLEILKTAGGYDYMQGTSMATPHVAGLAALVWGYNPSLTSTQVKDVVADTGDNLVSLDGKTITGKRINAYNALNVFNPVIGYDSDNIIPTSSISQATDGTGIITVNFKVKDGMAGLAESLSNFGYSTDGGSIWKTPTSGDASLAFSDDWADNAYVSSLAYPTSSYSFTFNSKHADFADLNNAEQNNVKIRFKAGDGAKTSAYAESGVFAIDNLPLDPPTIGSPATTTYTNADSYSVTGSAIAGYTVFIGRVGGDIIATSTPTSTAYEFTVSLDQNATNTFRVFQKDNFGNQSPSVDSASVIEDSGAPSFLLYSAGGDASSPYHTSSTTPQIIYGATDISPTLDCRWDTVDAAYSIMSASSSFSLNSGATTSIVLSDQGEDGSKAVHISCRDLAGNENSADDNLDVSFVLDTVPPTAVLSNTPSSGTTARTTDIAVEGDGVAFYKYKLDGGSYSSSSGTSTHISLSGLSIGAHTLYVVGGDEAGNWQEEASSTEHTWTIASSGGGGGGGGGGTASDQTAPTISNIVATPTSGTTATITWQTNEGSLSWVLYGTTTAYGQQAKTSASYIANHSVALTGLTASTIYHYQVKSQDAIGNIGTYTDKTFTTLVAGAVATTTVSTTAATSTVQKSVIQMTREEIISLIIRLIAFLQAKAQSVPVSLPIAGPANAVGIAGIPADFTFKTNLKMGDNSADVRYLQIVLNSDPNTRIAVSGFGSAGYETIHFGRSTQAAVKKFQLKYRAELMDPFGLASPVGEVGDTTRGKLNQILSASR